MKSELLLDSNVRGSGFDWWAYKVEKCSFTTRKTKEKKPEFEGISLILKLYIKYKTHVSSCI